MEEKDTTETTTEGQEPEDTAVEETGTEAVEAEETGSDKPDLIGGVDFADLPPATQTEIKKLRAEAKAARTEAKRQAADEARQAAEAEAAKALEAERAEHAEWRKRVAKELGLIEDEKTDLTPEQVIEKITRERDTERQAREEREQQFRALSLEVAVQDAANMHGAIPDKLLDSRRFMKAVADLDPSQEGYRVAVADAVKTAIEADESLKAAEPKPKPPAVSGGTTVAGTGKAKSIEDMSIDEMVAAGFTGRR